MPRRRLVFGISLVFLLIVAGCKPSKPAPTNLKTRFRGVTLRVVVPDNPALVSWLEDQRGEWSAQTGGEVQLVKPDAIESPDADSSARGIARSLAASAADVLIYPTSQMGSVIASGSVVKVPADVFQSAALEHRDIAPAVHDHLITWDREPHAIPLSADCMLVFYRTDLFADEAQRDRFQQQHGRALEPPATWGEFDQLAAFFDGQDFDGDGDPDRSVAIAGCADSLVCRAAALGKLPRTLSFYFDISSGEPLIAGPVFQQALDDWSRVAKYLANGGAADPTLSTLASGRAALAIGSSGLASRLIATAGESSAGKFAAKIGCAPLPASTRVFQHDKRTWIEVPEKPNRVAVVRGIVASVLDSSPKPAAAFDLLTFLTSRERSLVPVTAQAYRLAPYRLSHVVDPAPWSAAGWSSGVSSFVAATRESLSESNVVTTIRILGADEFHRSLEIEIEPVFRSDSGAADAIAAAAKSWREIAERLGTDRVSRQYRYSLGMPVVR